PRHHRLLAAARRERRRLDLRPERIRRQHGDPRVRTDRAGSHRPRRLPAAALPRTGRPLRRGGALGRRLRLGPADHAGGMPHSPSGRLANHTNSQVPHVLDTAEIARLVEEYAFSAAEARAAGLDGVEVHANHEDLLQLFLSPATNRRDDAYGGDHGRRMRLLLDVLHAIRREVGPDFTVGVRLNMDELFEGGYDLAEGLAIASSLQASGTVDYLHCVVGNNWGAPSYIQTHHYAVAHWSGLARRFREALDIPVVYTGRVATAAAAARVVAEGHADVVGMARAMFADGDLVAKARSGRAADIRPLLRTHHCL